MGLRSGNKTSTSYCVPTTTDDAGSPVVSPRKCSVTDLPSSVGDWWCVHTFVPALPNCSDLLSVKQSFLHFSFCLGPGIHHEMVSELVYGANSRCVLHHFSSLTCLTESWGLLWSTNGPTQQITNSKMMLFPRGSTATRQILLRHRWFLYGCKIPPWTTAGSRPLWFLTGFRSRFW